MWNPHYQHDTPDYQHDTTVEEEDNRANEAQAASAADADADLAGFLEELDDLSVWDVDVDDDLPPGHVDVIPQVQHATPPTATEVALDATTPTKPWSPVRYYEMKLPTMLVPGADHNPQALPKPVWCIGRSRSPQAGGHTNTTPVTEPLSAFVPHALRRELQDASDFHECSVPSPGDPNLGRASVAGMVAVTSVLDSKMRWIRLCEPNQQPRAIRDLKECIKHFQKLCDLSANCLHLGIDPRVYSISEVAVKSLTVATSNENRGVRVLSHIATRLLLAVRQITRYVMRLQSQIEIRRPPHRQSLFQERLETIGRENPTPIPPELQRRVIRDPRETPTFQGYSPQHQQQSPQRRASQHEQQQQQQRQQQQQQQTSPYLPRRNPLQ